MIVPQLLIVLVVLIHQSVDACWVVWNRLANTPVVERESPPTQNCSSRTYTGNYNLQSLDKECGPCLPGPERFHCPFRPPTLSQQPRPLTPHHPVGLHRDVFVHHTTSWFLIHEQERINVFFSMPTFTLELDFHRNKSWTTPYNLESLISPPLSLYFYVHATKEPMYTSERQLNFKLIFLYLKTGRILLFRVPTVFCAIKLYN